MEAAVKQHIDTLINQCRYIVENDSTNEMSNFFLINEIAIECGIKFLKG